MGPFDKDSGEYGVAAPRSTTEIMPGFIGYGLRRVSDDAYIQIARPSCAMGALLGYCNGGFDNYHRHVFITDRNDHVCNFDRSHCIVNNCNWYVLYCDS